MEFVEPIKDKAKIAKMKHCLKHGYGKKQGSLRDWLLFTLGISSGLRISDLLKLTVEDVDGMDRLSIQETKTGKPKDFPLRPICKDAINEYLSTPGIPKTGALFPSRKGGTSISRQQAYDIINGAALEAKVITKTNGVHIGTHSLRKTMSYHLYNAGVGIEIIMDMLNHSSIKTTMKYIGITRETMDAAYLSLDI